MQKVVTISHHYGSAEGFVANTKAYYFKRYLVQHTPRIEIIVTKLQIHNILALLRAMRVEEEDQGKGLGKKLLKDFEREAKKLGAKGVFLIADENESQKKGFKLEEFYKRNGYTKLSQTDSGPLMFKLF